MTSDMEESTQRICQQFKERRAQERRGRVEQGQALGARTGLCSDIRAPRTSHNRESAAWQRIRMQTLLISHLPIKRWEMPAA